MTAANGIVPHSGSSSPCHGISALEMAWTHRPTSSGSTSCVTTGIITILEILYPSRYTCPTIEATASHDPKSSSSNMATMCRKCCGWSSVVTLIARMTLRRWTPSRSFGIATAAFLAAISPVKALRLSWTWPSP